MLHACIFSCCKAHDNCYERVMEGNKCKYGLEVYVDKYKVTGCAKCGKSHSFTSFLFLLFVFFQYFLLFFHSFLFSVLIVQIKFGQLHHVKQIIKIIFITSKLGILNVTKEKILLLYFAFLSFSFLYYGFHFHSFPHAFFLSYAFLFPILFHNFLCCLPSTLSHLYCTILYNRWYDFRRVRSKFVTFFNFRPKSKSMSLGHM